MRKQIRTFPLLACLISAAACQSRTNFNEAKGKVSTFFGEDVRTEEIELPIDRNNLEKGKFKYLYQLRKGSDSDSRTLLVYFVGGPGGTGIGQNPKFSKFSQLDMDIRGVGKNSSQELQPQTSFRSVVYAQDIFDIISARKNEFDTIVLFGMSYGTVPATILANFIEKESQNNDQAFPKLGAVYLDSTVARAFDENRGDVRKGFKRIWNKEFEKASPQLQQKLQEENPFGQNSLFWGNLIVNYAFQPYGDNAPLAALFEDLEQALKDNDTESYFQKEMRPHQIEHMSKKPGLLPPNSVYGHVMCTELSPEGHEADIELRKGKVEYFESNLCATGKFQFAAFDSKDYAYKALTFYFVGGMDPVTELEDTEYHALHSNISKNSFTALVPNGTHTPLSSVFRKCMAGAFESYQNQEEVQASLKKCSRSFKFYSSTEKAE
jgi:hypothetical protein